MNKIRKIVILTTAGSAESALEMANGLVGERLAACVNVIENIRSIYRWKGEVCDDREALLVIKTGVDRFDAVSSFISEVSAYECPEIIMLPIVGGSEAYLSWLDSCIGPESG